MKTFKIILGSLIALVVLLALIGSKQPEVGGSFNPVVVDFAEGISVDGELVIGGDGVVVAPLGEVGAGANLTRPVLTPTADTTLTVAQTGAIVQMGTAGLDVTLPAATASAGVEYRFVVSQAVATTNMTIVGAPADIIEGSLIVAGAVVDCDASDLLTFVIDGENIGDYVELYSDGTKWMIGDSGVLTASKLTCTG